MIFDLLINKVIGEDWWLEDEPGEVFISEKYVRQELAKAEGAEGLRIVIDSPGGSVFEGITIFNIIRDFARNHPDMTVTTYIQGMAVSMASALALAACGISEKNKVIAEDNSVFMIHNARGLVEGNRHDLRDGVDFFENMDKMLRGIYVRKTGKKESDIEKMMDEETWLWGKEILDAGFVDEIIEDTKEDLTNDKDGKIAFAKAGLKNSQAKIQKMAAKAPSRNWGEAAACVKDATVGVPTEKSTVEKPENKNGGCRKMTVDELKKDNPDVYAAVVAEGEKAGAEKERARASRLMAMGEKAGAMDYAMECIKNNVSPTDETVIDTFMDKKVAAEALAAVKTDENVPALPVSQNKDDKKAMADAFDAAIVGGDDDGDN